MMRYKLLILCCLFNLFAADKKKPESKPKVDKKEQRQTQSIPDPEDRWMCRIGSYHQCACSAMVSEHWEEVNAQCTVRLMLEGKNAYRKCLQENEMNPCAIIQKADTQHPAHTCRRTCAKSRCLCNDGPKCFGPSLMEGDSGEEPDGIVHDVIQKMRMKFILPRERGN